MNELADNIKAITVYISFVLRTFLFVSTHFNPINCLLVWGKFQCSGFEEYVSIADCCSNEGYIDIFVFFSSFILVSVIYIVDLRRAVYYQKCHDPDCKGINHILLPNLIVFFFLINKR